MAMEDKAERLLQDIVTAQVLILARHLKAEKERKGVTSTSDFISDAVRLIKEKKSQVLATLGNAGA